jgi:Ephrin
MTSTPGGMEFSVGQDYFFITTSEPKNLEQKSGGRCSTHNMKLLFKTVQWNGNTDVDEKTSFKLTHRFNDVTDKAPQKSTNGESVDFVDNDISKFYNIVDQAVVGMNQRPSPKLGPLFYPVQPQDNDAYDVIGVASGGIVVHSNVDGVTSYRRQGRNHVSML